MNLVHAIVILLSFYQVAQTSQRHLTASSGGGGGGGARGGGSTSSSRAGGTSAGSSRAGSSTTTKSVTSASQSRYSSGLSKYKGPIGVTNLASGSRAVFVPTGNNYFIWFLLVNGDVEEYGNENDDVNIDKNDLPPGCVVANDTSIPTNGTMTFDQQYLEQTHTYSLDDLDITCGPVDITTADDTGSSLSGGAIFGIVVGSVFGFIIVAVLIFIIISGCCC